MSLKDQVLTTVIDQPGISRDRLCDLFDLTDYRLNRVLRQLVRDFSGKTIVHSREHGVWIVDVDPERCSGMIWHGIEAGGYHQCLNTRDFADGCCYEHSQCESPSMTAFLRTLAYLVGPAEPTAHSVSGLNLSEVERLVDGLKNISPMTLKDARNKAKYTRLLGAGLAMLKWKLQQRRDRSENWIPPEFRDRHARSSVNPFEYSLKKHFELLQVPTDSAKHEVLKAWKKLCLRFHPDMEGGDEDKMKQINSAKEWIFRIRRWD
ncbi:MAG: J domain-containing protein [Desulfomonilaceae bacterium]|nr:J domain-containing protein [Desulfomonilaceae bacterium]